jgi:diguanylate cyclase (GGDEF)-like protein
MYQILPELQDQLKSCRTLPTPPAIALQLIDLCHDPAVEVSELADLISCDPALSAKVLRIVNSPLNALTVEVTTISRAIMLLGPVSIRAIALSFSLARNFKNGSKGILSQMKYWERSLVSAVAAQRIGLLVKLPAQEELFLAGLLQDIGILAFDRALGERYETIADPAGADHRKLVELERQKLQTDHAQVGAWLAKEWSIPPFLQHAIHGSHDPETGIPCGNAGSFVRCLALASTVADIWIDPDTEAASEKACAKARSLMGLDPGGLNRVLSGISEAVPDISTIFEVGIENPGELDHILESARETMLTVGLQLAKDVRQKEGIVKSLTSRNRRLEERSQRDCLTHLFNRTFFDKTLEDEFRASVYTGDPLSIILCDLDHFKRINDTYGHLSGDEALKAVSRILAGSVRRKDIAARYGGDEFVLILLDADADVAARISEKIRKTIHSTDLLLDGKGSAKVTISVGHATQTGAKPFATPEDLLKAADGSLYSAKRLGRNRVVGFVSYCSR